MSILKKDFEKTWKDENGLKHRARLQVFLYDGSFIFSYFEESQLTRSVKSGFCYKNNFQKEVSEHFPEQARYLKFHGLNSEFKYYLRVGLYHSGNIDENGQRSPVNLDEFKHSTLWPDADIIVKNYTEKELTSILNQRLSTLKDEFKQALEYFDFTH